MRPVPTRLWLPPTALLVVRTVYVVLTLLFAAGLVAAAALVPAPASVLPAIVILAIVMPMAAAWELSFVIPALGHAARRGRAVARLRRELSALPETRHPLGL